MKYSSLNRRHKSVCVDEMADHEALYLGGKAFEARIQRFLPQRPAEPNELYAYRLKVCHYVNYAQEIVNYFVCGLFTSRTDVRVSDKASTPEWFAEFQSNCDRRQTDLLAFWRSVVGDAQIKGKGYVLVDFPEPTDTVLSRADWIAQGLGSAYLCRLEPECVLDWKCDESGAFVWVVVHSFTNEREEPSDDEDIVKESWTIYYRDRWERYGITYKATEPPKGDTDIPLVKEGPSATPGIVPIVVLEMSKGLSVMDIVASPVKENARSRNAMSWSLQRTSYAMRIFALKEPTQALQPHGAGYGLVVGHEDKVTWDAPPADAFSPLSAWCSDLRNEIFRVAQVMALGVDNSAPSAVGRSGESKAADNSQTEVVLKAMGKIVCEAIQQALNLISLGRKEPTKWIVSGLNKFSLDSLDALVNRSVSLATINVPSTTFNQLYYTKLALDLLPDASQEQRDLIAEEIEDAFAHPAQPARSGVSGTPPPGEIDNLEGDSENEPTMGEDEAAA